MARQKRRAPAQGRRPVKRSRYARAPRRALPMTLTVKKKFWLENWQPSAVATANFWRYFTFNLDQMPDIATYTALFDIYRINAIKVEFHPRFDSFAGNDTTDETPPGVTNLSGTRMSLMVDTKSALVPTGAYNSSTYNDFLQQGNPRNHVGIRPFSIYFRPQVGESVGANIAGGLRRRATWLQLVTANSVPHAGFHAFAWTPNFNASGSFGNSFDLLVTYYVQFRGMR